MRLSVREDILNMIIFYRSKNADGGDYEETGELVEIDESKRKAEEEEEEARKKLTKYEEQQILSPAEAKRHIASSFLSELKNQPIVSSCVTHILQFCGYFKGQEEICFNPTSWHLLTYNFLRGHKF